MADNKTNIDRANEVVTEIGRQVRKVGTAVAEEVKKLPVEETVKTAGEVATQTGRRMRKAAGRLGQNLRKRLKQR